MPIVSFLREYGIGMRRHDGSLVRLKNGKRNLIVIKAYMNQLSVNFKLIQCGARHPEEEFACSSLVHFVCRILRHVISHVGNHTVKLITLDTEMFSVKLVEPWKSRESKKGPRAAQLSSCPVAATENK